MAYSGINKWTPPRKLGEIPCVSTRFNLSVENEQADAGRDGRTRLAATTSSPNGGSPRAPEDRQGKGRSVVVASMALGRNAGVDRWLGTR